MSSIPQRQIRAFFDEHTIRVYQAFNDHIASAAVDAGTFVSPPFSMSRMTWIKPSFLWMMYRAGWGHKDADQSRILAIDITHEGFAWALKHSCPSHPPSELTKSEWNKLKTASPVRIQWDPERDFLLQPLPYRTIQIGLSKEASSLYVTQWIQKITDVTSVAHEMHELVIRHEIEKAKKLLPVEIEYSVNK